MKVLFYNTWNINFSETDASSLVHFANYYRQMEITEHKFLESLNIPVLERQASFIKGWPRIEAHCKFKRPLFLNDTVEVQLGISELSPKTITYQFHFIKHSPENQCVAKGTMTTVYANLNTADNALNANSINSAILEILQSQLS